MAAAGSVAPFDEGERLLALANDPKAFVRVRDGDHATLVRDGLYHHIWPFLAELKAALNLASDFA